MLPLLKSVEDQNEHKISDIINTLAEEFNISEEERQIRLPSGDRVFNNRVYWARLYLIKAGLIESPKRAHIKIINNGLDVLEKNPEKIDFKFLEQIDAFQEYKESAKKTRTTLSEDEPITTEETPEETLENAFHIINEGLALDLINQVKSANPLFFEQLVLDLLIKMGYGGLRKDAAQRLGRSHDGGIDGIIKEDKLGLDAIYIQAKRWENTVGRPEIQRFVGALEGKRAKKGIFITTSSFSNEAVQYISNINRKIVLIDGEQLTEYMIEYDIGVSTSTTYRIKKIDSDYFEEE